VSQQSDLASLTNRSITSAREPLLRAPYDQPMELIEFGRLSEERYSELVGDEEDPWKAEAFALKWRPKDHHVGICDEDGRLVAVAGLVVVEVQFGEQLGIPVVGLGGVIVTASHRGRGLGARVISGALSRAEALGPQIAMLFCRPEMAGLYRRYGFAELPGPVLVGQPGGVVEIPGGVTMWRPLHPNACLPEGAVKVHGLPF
jgi:GNAT superfamily N-acetyltransferase